jgi:hypothetical protein
VDGSRNSWLVEWAAQEIHALRIVFQGNRKYDLASEGDLARLGALLNAGMRTRGKPEEWPGTATEFRREVKLEIVRTFLGEKRLTTTAQLTRHEATCLVNRLARKGEWDLNESAYRLLDVLEGAAVLRLLHRLTAY